MPVSETFAERVAKDCTDCRSSWGCFDKSPYPPEFCQVDPVVDRYEQGEANERCATCRHIRNVRRCRRCSHYAR